MPIARAIRDRIERRLPPKAANFWCHVTEGAFASFGGAMVGGQLFAVLVAALGGSAATLGALTSIGSFTFLAPLLLAPRPVRADALAATFTAETTGARLLT